MARASGASGVTLTELVITIAILGVLCLMLVPSFVHARESAREALCLSNVKIIAQAVRMYLTEHNGSLPPNESCPEVLTYFDGCPGRGHKQRWYPPTPKDLHCNRARQANPYLRWPLILSDYLPGRDVWRCPNARLESGASFIAGSGDWLSHLKLHEGRWGRTTDLSGPCAIAWPPGWGGVVTDSLAQGRLAVPVGGKGRQASPGMFLQSIGANEAHAAGLTVQDVEDPAWYVICADAGANTDGMATGTLAYPDICRLECDDAAGWEARWEDCPWSRTCGATPEVKRDRRLLRTYTRHFGGVNIGFLDGHARWFSSEVVLQESPTTGNPLRGRLRGYEPGARTADAPPGLAAVLREPELRSLPDRH